MGFAPRLLGNTAAFAALLLLGFGCSVDHPTLDVPGGSGGGGGTQTPGGSGGDAGAGGSGGEGGGLGGGGAEGGDGGDGGPLDGCLEHAGCPFSKPFCAPDRQCRACLLDEHCPLDLPACVDGACTRCEDQAPCAERGYCELESGACVDCRDHDDCVDGRCSQEHVCHECLEDEDCGAAGVCEANACVLGERCDDETPCAEGKVCHRLETGAPAGFCRPRCEVVAQEGCDEGLLCRLHSFAEGEPVGACVEPNGGGAAGEPCSAEARCEANLLCVAVWNDRYCAPYCDPSIEGVCGEGMSCEGVRFGQGQDEIPVCLEEDTFCESNADCPEGKACAPFLGGDQTLLVCTSVVGEKRGGEDCTASTQCESGLCLAQLGICFGGCRSGADCGSGASCLAVNFGDVVVDTCLKTCDAADQCPSGQGCDPWLSADRGEIAGFCTPSSGTVAAGESCTSSSDCRSGSCLATDRGGYCASLCADDEGCGGATECVDRWYYYSGEDGISGTEDDLEENMRTCRGEVCSSKWDCAPGWDCAPEDNGGGGDWGAVELRCRPGWADRVGGEICDGRCFCSIFQGIFAACFVPCAVDADCNVGSECVSNITSVIGSNGAAYSYDACLPADP